MSLAKRIFLGLGMSSLLLVGAACTKKTTAESPESVLQVYVTTAINAKNGGDRARLFEYTTGKALERLQAMTDEDFLNSLVKPEYKFVHFSTYDKREENDGGLSLVYELVYENAAGDTNAKITNRKIAYFKKDGNIWKINDTRNVKSFVEMKDGLSVQYP